MTGPKLFVQLISHNGKLYALDNYGSVWEFHEEARWIGVANSLTGLQLGKDDCGNEYA